MINPEIYKWFYSLSTNNDFLETLSLSDRLYDEQYHMELLLRFIALANYDYDNKKDVGDFLDDINEDILNSQTFDFEKVKNNFESTFKNLNRILGEKSFKKYTVNDFKGKFLESAFEAVSTGLSANIESYNFPEDDNLIIQKIQNLYFEQVYIQTSGSGSNAKSRIPKLVPFAKIYFQK